MSSSRGSDRDSLREFFNTPVEDLADVFLSPMLLADPPRTGWTDEVCMTEGQKCCMWKKIPTNEIEGHLITFVNLWFAPSSTDIEIGSINRIVGNVLLMMPLGVGISGDLLLEDVFNSAIETAKTPAAAADNEKLIIKEPLLGLLNHREKVQLLAFHGWLKQNFVQLKMMGKRASRGQSHSTEYDLISQKLRAVLGFCALILMRLMVKGEQQIKRYFPYGASNAFNRLFPKAGLNVSLAAPATQLLQSAPNHLSSSNMNGKTQNAKLLYLLVFQYLKSVAKDDRASQLARRILEEGCLNVMEGNGMGMVTMFQDVKRMYHNIEERQLLAMIVNRKIHEWSRRQLIKFLDTYTLPDNLQYSWKWASIINHSYFSNLSIRYNTQLCSRFAALLLDTNPGVFEHKHLQENPFRNSAIEWAKSAKKDFEMMNDKSQSNS